MVRAMRGLWVVVAFVSWVGVARAESPPAFPDKTDRLVALAKTWAQVKFFHPAIATKDIDWDRALVTAIPKVEAATTTAEYRNAVQGMLAATHDPVTTVLDAAPTKPQAPTPSEWLTWPSPGVLEVNVAAMTGGTFDYAGIVAKGQRVVAEAVKAKVLILDVRGASEFGAELGIEQLASALPSFDEWPTARMLEHRGYRTQHGASTGGYHSTFVTIGANPPHVGPKTGPAHVVFVAEANGLVPSYALALQAAGKGSIVASGPLRSDTAIPTTEIALGAGLRAQIRIGESLWGPAAADVVVAKGADPLARARALAKRPPKAKKRARKPVALAPLRVRDDADYADTPYPSREHRMLAGIKVWAVLEHLFPYRYLIDDWEAVLREMLPRLAQAPDREAYLRVVREMGVRAGDGHIGVVTTVPPAAKRGIPPFETRLVERKLAIVRVLDAAEAKRLGVAVGDVIESVDGKPVGEAMADLRRITSGSTTEAREQRVAQRLLWGDDGTTVKLGIRDARGKSRVVATKRESKYVGLAGSGSTPHWKKLAGNIGYVDLRTLTVPEVDAMFRELGSTKAIIFDMRGYPNGTAWSLAPRLNVKRAKYGAQFLQPVARGGEDGLDQRIRFLQPFSPLGEGESLYKGKVVVLIDDRAISQAEHTCLFLQESAGATFVGSPTHGANGDVTAMRLPGGLRMWFTGQEVRHVDGKQLQKVGIQPHIRVRPTLAGIRAGKDEVLERALASIANGK